MPSEGPGAGEGGCSPALVITFGTATHHPLDRFPLASSPLGFVKYDVREQFAD